MEQARLESVLHQLELSRREIGGDGLPYGLKLILNALTPSIHGGDPVAALALDGALAALRERIKNPDFIKDFVKQWLLENPHWVRVVLKPDLTLNAQRARQEADRLHLLRQGLSAVEQQRIIQQAADLKARQELEDDPEILPRLGLADIPADLKIASGEEKQVASLPVFWFKAATNRLVYMQYVLDPPAMSTDLIDLLPVFSTCLPEVGCGGRDYLETQAHQSAISGGVAARVSMRASVDSMDAYHCYFCVSGKALTRNHQPLTQLLQDTLKTARFDELSRLRELVAQMRSAAEMRVTDNGHMLALSAASAGLSRVAALNDRWGGIMAVKRLKELDKSLDKPKMLADFAAQLDALRMVLFQASGRMLVVGEEEDFNDFSKALAKIWGDVTFQTGAGGLQAPTELSGPAKTAWATVTTVNYCARVHKTVPYSHPDAPILSILGQYLKNGFLHRAIRERGGAYGGGAGYDSDTGLFRFYSYRDPRMEETLADFQASLEWLKSGKCELRALEEAILGVVGVIDRPGSPAGESKRAFHDLLYGRLPHLRRAYRQRVMAVTTEDLIRVADTYLHPDAASLGVLTNSEIMEHRLGEDWVKRVL